MVCSAYENVWFFFCMKNGFIKWQIVISECIYVIDMYTYWNKSAQVYLWTTSVGRQVKQVL